MAKTPAERKREQREREKMDEEERLARLHSRTIKLDLFKGTDAVLIAAMERCGIEEPEDMLTRLIYATQKMSEEDLVFLDLK